MIQNTLSDPFNIETGLRQGDKLSTILFQSSMRESCSRYVDKPEMEQFSTRRQYLVQYKSKTGKELEQIENILIFSEVTH